MKLLRCTKLFFFRLKANSILKLVPHLIFYSFKNNLAVIFNNSQTAEQVHDDLTSYLT